MQKSHAGEASGDKRNISSLSNESFYVHCNGCQHQQGNAHHPEGWVGLA